MVQKSKFTDRFSFILTLFLFAISTAACGRAAVTGPATPTSAANTPTQSVTATPTTAPSATSSVTSTTAPSATTIPNTQAITSTSTPAPTPPPGGPLSGTTLLEALRGGGYVLYFRHAATTPTPDDARPVVLTDCSTQRNLSGEGQAQAQEIGRAFRQMGIPVGQVLASPFCRALDTARLAFERVEAEPLLENLETTANDAERETRTEGLRRLLATPPDPGTNTILAGHGFNINAVMQVSLSEGEAAIFRPDGAGGFELVAEVKPEDWAALE